MNKYLQPLEFVFNKRDIVSQELFVHIEDLQVNLIVSYVILKNKMGKLYNWCLQMIFILVLKHCSLLIL